MNAKELKKFRKTVRNHVKTILSYMSFLDRIRFVFTGNWWTSLQKAERDFRADKISGFDWQQLIFWIFVVIVFIVGSWLFHLMLWRVIC